MFGMESEYILCQELALKISGVLLQIMDLKEIQQNISLFNEEQELKNEFIMNNEIKSFGEIKIDKIVIKEIIENQVNRNNKNKYSCVWSQRKYY